MKNKERAGGMNRMLIALGVFALLCLCVLLYLNKTEEEIVYAQVTTFEKTIATKGYVMRYETMLNSSVAGTYISEAEEGKKVCVGESVAAVYTGSEAAAIREKISIKKNQINELRRTYDMLLSHNEASLDDYIKKTLSGVVSETEKGHCSNFSTVKNVLNTIVSVNAGRASAQADYDMQMEELRNEMQSYIALLGNRATEIYAPVSGAYYAKCDGCEESLTADKIDEITIADLEQVSIKDDDENATGKITNNFSCYLTGIVPAEKADSFQPNKIVTLILSDGTEFSAEVYRSTVEEENCLLIFYVSTQIPELMEKREIAYTIVEHSYKGYKVPIEAIHVYHSGMETDADVAIVEDTYGEETEGIVYKAYQTPNTFVYVNKTGVKTIRWIDIIHQTDTYAIVKENLMYNGVRLTYGLELHDRIIVE